MGPVRNRQNRAKRQQLLCTRNNTQMPKKARPCRVRPKSAVEMRRRRRLLSPGKPPREIDQSQVFSVPSKASRLFMKDDDNSKDDEVILTPFQLRKLKLQVQAQASESETKSAKMY